MPVPHIRDTWKDTPYGSPRDERASTRSGTDEATKIVHSSMSYPSRGDDPLIHHNPSGGTGYQEGPRRENPTGETGYEWGPRRENPTGETVSGYADMPVRTNPGGGVSGPLDPDQYRRQNPLGDSKEKPTGVGIGGDISQRKNPS